MSEETGAFVSVEPVSRKRGKTVHEPRSVSAQRTPLALSVGSRFNVPQEIKDADPDHVYGFVPDRTDGDEDSLDKAISKGWMFVHESDNPELTGKYFNSSYRKHEDGLLRKGGQVLMKMHKDHAAAWEAEYQEQTRLQQEEVKKASGYSDAFSQNPLMGSLGVNFGA